MSNSSSLPNFNTFGECLRHLRRRARLTQRDLGLAVGYSEGHITRLENGQRLPDLIAVKGLFVEALDLMHEQEFAKRLIDLAIAARGEQVESFISRRTNLPAQVTRFIGRDREIKVVRQLLTESRLVSLIGSGGIGKTRLALEVATYAQVDFEDGVRMIEFAPITIANQVIRTVADAYQLAEHPGVPLIDTLIARLESCHTLLIFDNCEHLVESCAVLTEHLLQSCPRLHILVTSREALRCMGEMLWRVPSLSQIESQQLFMTRAQLVRQDLEITADYRPTLAQICQQLDGMPLAIELAAARMSSLSLDQIAGRLNDRFNLLSIGKRTAIPRHQTLRAAIAWSFDLLTTDEQTLMACLSVFQGGFTAEAAQAVFDRAYTSNLVASLVDKSLVIVEVKAKATRYHLLETIRQYSLEQLIASGFEIHIRERHLMFFLHLAEEVTDMSGPHVVDWKRRMSFEEDNLRAAFAHASTRDDQGETALRLAASMYPYRNYLDLHMEEGLVWVNTALARGSAASVSSRARALLAKAFFCNMTFDISEAARIGEESLTLFRMTEDRIGMAWCLDWLAFFLNDVRTLAWAEEALDLFQKLGSVDGEAHALQALAAYHLRAGNNAQAAAYLEQAITIAEWQISDCVGYLYIAHPERALQLCAEEVTRWQMGGNESGDAELLSEYGLILTSECRYEQARSVLDQFIQWEERNNAMPTPSYLRALMALAIADLALGCPDQAIAHLQQAQEIARTMLRRGFVDVAKSFIASILISTGNGNFTHASIDLRECLQLFRKLDFRAGAVCSFIQIADQAYHQGNLHHAVQLLGAAISFNHNLVELPYWMNCIPSLWYRYAQDAIIKPIIQDTRTHLGNAEFETGFATGKNMTFDQATVYALESGLSRAIPVRMS